MPFKVQVGPPQISIHQGQTILVSESDGQINWPSEKGLFFLDTRVVSSWAIYANGEPWELLNGGAITHYAARIFLTNRAFETESGTIPARMLGLTIDRWISGGMHEDIDVTNNSMKPIRFQLEIATRSDFADIFEVKSNRIVRRGRIVTEWLPAQQRLHTTYRNHDFSSDDCRFAEVGRGNVCQWSAQLRSRSRTRRSLAQLRFVYAARWQPPS